MLHRISWLLYAILTGVFILFTLLLPISASHAFAASKPELALNLQQGPLGVSLTLKGKNFPPGQASFTYIDGQGVPGTFQPPSYSSTLVSAEGSFFTNNVILPASGPAGVWKIVVTDSLGAISTVEYQVIAAPGTQTAGAPTLIINPTSGMAGDLIAFTGSNWLPTGTALNLTLLAGTTSLPLLDTSLVSDKDGAITGAFHVPANLNSTQASVVATDVATGALHAQAQILIVNSSPTPTASPGLAASPSPAITATSIPPPASTATPIPVKTLHLGSDSTRGPLTPLNRESWGVELLIVGVMLAVVALMLILFLIPWSERRGNIPRGRHY